MAKFHTGYYIPKNPSKYKGKPGKFRSSWEMQFMMFLDFHPNVIQWSSEPLKIPYLNPLTGKVANYIPDFYVLMLGNDGKQRAELIEIKPARQAFAESARTVADKLAFMVNQAKWAAATEFCHKNGMNFRVMTENEIFRGIKKKIVKKSVKKIIRKKRK